MTENFTLRDPDEDFAVVSEKLQRLGLGLGSESDLSKGL